MPCTLLSVIIESKKIDSQAIINSSIKKLRAIIITTLTSICALIPFAFDPSNRNSQVSMSIAIIGGLTVSLFVVLYLIPSVLFLVLRKKEK